MSHQTTEAAYRRALEWIHSIGRFGMKQGLQRIEALLSLLGDPHRRLKCIHIGGTNGKGSVAAMLAAVLQESGYRTALYTSPYISSFTNRMSIDGHDIGNAALVELVERLRPLVDKISSDERLGPVTEFEAVTALAFTYFAQEQPDLVVLEVGLGGRFDATNVVTPLLSVITNIDLDHTQVLGRRLQLLPPKRQASSGGRPRAYRCDGASAPGDRPNLPGAGFSLSTPFSPVRTLPRG